MKRLFNQCGRYRRSISLLASGALPERDRDAVENHLAACAGCRKYYEEIKSVSAPLAGWEGISHTLSRPKPPGCAGRGPSSRQPGRNPLAGSRREVFS